MTRAAFEAQAHHLRSLIGEVCVRAAVGYANALMLGFGTFKPPDERGYQEPERNLVVECPWRLDTPDRVIVGRGDDYAVVPAEIQVCQGRRVIGIEVVQPSYTARVTFDGDLTLWAFPDSAADYQDNSEDPSVSWYVAGWAVPGDWDE